MMGFRHAAGGTRCPLVIFSAGFLLDASLYRTYARQLASWGYVAVLYDLSELRDDRQTVVAIRWGWARGTRGGVCGEHKCRERCVGVCLVYRQRQSSEGVLWRTNRHPCLRRLCSRGYALLL